MNLSNKRLGGGFTLYPKGFSLRLKSGFTLIELLVVVAIIGILAAIVLTSLSSAREKARDARRDADIKTIQTALEVYYLDHGEYPDSLGGGAPNSTRWANSGDSSWADLEAEMGVTLPRDPVNDITTTTNDWSGGGNKSLNYAYSIRSGYLSGCPVGQAYILVYRHESGDTPASESPGITRCDNGNIQKFGNGSITVGVTPAG